MNWDVGLDLGTENLRIAELHEGFTLEAPCALGYREGRDLPVCGGETAGRMIERTCQNMRIERPYADGLPVSAYHTRQIIRWCYSRLKTVNRKRPFSALITCAPFARSAQQLLIADAALDAGANSVALVRDDMAAAIGAGLKIFEPEATLLVQVGAGKMSATLFTFGQVAAYAWQPYGLSRIDERVRRILRNHEGYRVGLETAREIKHTLGCAQLDKKDEDIIMRAAGFSIQDSLPREFDIETKPILEACEDVMRELTELCLTVVNDAPEELAADLCDAGAVLVGAGAQMTGLDKRLSTALGIPCRVADNAPTCAIRGVYEMMLNPEIYEEAVLLRRRISKTSAEKES